MTHWLVQTLINSAGVWTYPLAFVLVFLDASVFLGFIMPGEAPAIVGGVLAGAGSISFIIIWATIAVAAVCGDSLSYAIGKWIGRERAVRHGRRVGVTDERFDRAEGFFDDHGGKSIFLGRFASVFRPIIPMVAGATRYPFRKFLVYNIPAGIAWGGIFTALGLWAGENWEKMATWVDRFGWVIGLAIFCFIIYRIIKHRRRKRRRRREELHRNDSSEMESRATPFPPA